VCSYNGQGLVGRAIESVLAQGFGDYELLVVDDGSTDATLEEASSYRDGRIRVVRSDRNVGISRNRSRAVRLSRADLIKFVDQDDWIEPDCLAEHVRLLASHATLGLTFSRRRTELQDEVPAPAPTLVPLNEHNSGPALFARHLEAGFPMLNWLGEPTAVMLRRACFRRCGLFNRHVRSYIDMDMWLRVMAFFDVGFLDAELATRGGVGASARSLTNFAMRRYWLDRLWTLEGLSEFPDLSRKHPQLALMRRSEQNGLVVSLLTGRYRNMDRRQALVDSRQYLRHWLRGVVGGTPSAFEWL
jgi:glycosyltransferase involved in cell wall biosynthesis